MAKLKDQILKEEEHRRIVQENIERNLALDQLVKRSLAKVKHQWHEDMPDLEGEALADAEREFDYDSWMGEHGIGEGTAQDEVMSGAITDILLAHNRSKHGIGD